jgi:hypothetical protein
MSDLQRRTISEEASVSSKLDRNAASDMKEEEPLSAGEENIRHLIASKPLHVTVEPRRDATVEAKDEDPEDEDDSDYVPTAEEQALASIEEAAAEAKMEKFEQVDEEEEIEEETESDDDSVTEESFKKYLKDAIEDVQNIAHTDGQAILRKVMKEVETEDGEEVDPEVVEEAFHIAKDAVLGEELNDEENEVLERQELDEALEVVKSIGRLDAGKLVGLVHENFYELTGRTPDLNDVRNVMSRLKQCFEAEAAEALEEDDLQSRIDVLREEPVIDKMNEAQTEAMLELASKFATQKMATSARKYFIDAVKREPTSLEFDELLIAVGTARFVNLRFFGDSKLAQFDKGDESGDSDYDPMAPEEVEQYEKDRIEDVDEDAENLDDERLLTIGEKIGKLVAESEQVNGPRPVAVPKPVAFYSPIAQKKSKRRIAGAITDETIVNEQLLSKAVERFRQRNGREPNHSEVKYLESFFTQKDKYVHTAPIDFSSE